MADLESRGVRIGPGFSVICDDFWWLLAILGGKNGPGEELINGMYRVRQA